MLSCHTSILDDNGATPDVHMHVVHGFGFKLGIR
jgi:hypothetical protein